MKPTPRVRLRSVSSKNQSLQDILSTCTITDEVVSVEPIINGVHNTKLTLKKATGEKRVHFYNRLDISSILPVDFRPSANLIADINKLNLMGYDFTEDDLTVSNRRFVAQPYSLGYYGGIIDRLFTDSIIFGVKNLLALNGSRHYNRVETLGVTVNDVTHTLDLDTDEYEDDEGKSLTIDLIKAIQRLITTHFPLLECTYEKTAWLEIRNSQASNEDAGLVTIKNLNPDQPVEVKVQGWSNRFWDDSSEAYPDEFFNLLPITRLEKRGTYKVNQGLPSMVSLTMDDVVPMNDWWPENNIGDGDQSVNEFGKLLQINGATRSNTIPDFNQYGVLPQVSLCVPQSGVSALMRTITITQTLWNGNFPVGHFINLLPQEVKLESFLNLEPIVLGPAPMATMADRVFLASMYIDLPYDSSYEASTTYLELNGNKYPIPFEDVYPGSSSEVLSYLNDYYPEIWDILKFSFLGDQTNGDDFVYFENLTDEPVHLKLYWEHIEGNRLYVYPEFILQPAGALSGSYTLTDREYTTEDIPKVQDLINNGDLETITWRGVKSEFTYKSDYSNYDTWNSSPWSAILYISRNEDYYDGDTVGFLFTTSPFMEEFIFNEGLDSEVKFKIDPMPLSIGYLHE